MAAVTAPRQACRSTGVSGFIAPTTTATNSSSIPRTVSGDPVMTRVNRCSQEHARTRRTHHPRCAPKNSCYHAARTSEQVKHPTRGVLRVVCVTGRKQPDRLERADVEHEWLGGRVRRKSPATAPAAAEPSTTVGLVHSGEGLLSDDVQEYSRLIHPHRDCSVARKGTVLRMKDSGVQVKGSALPSAETVSSLAQRHWDGHAHSGTVCTMSESRLNDAPGYAEGLAFAVSACRRWLRHLRAAASAGVPLARQPTLNNSAISQAGSAMYGRHIAKP